MKTNNELLIKCWEQKKCNEVECPAYESTNLVCWLTAGTRCNGRVQTSFRQKLKESCINCEVFELNKRRALGKRQSDTSIMDTLEFMILQLTVYDSQLQDTNAELEKRINELSMLNEVNNALQRTLDLEQILYIILTGVTAGEAFGFNRAFLLLVDEEKKTVEGKMAVGPSSVEEAQTIWGGLTQRSTSLSELLLSFEDIQSLKNNYVNNLVKQLSFPLEQNSFPIITQAIREKRSFNVLNAKDDHRVNKELIGLLQVDAFAVVPLITEDKAIGVLLVDNLITNRCISESDLTLLQIFAGQASSAIQNARLYSQLKSKLCELEKAYADLKDSQTRLVRSERLAAVGEIVAMVAHEIRTPLVSLGGFAKLIFNETPKRDKHKEYLQIILEEVERLEIILNKILDFTRLADPVLKENSIHPIISETVCLLDAEIEKRAIRLKLHLDAGLPLILVDAAQMKQVFLNLLSNAVQAMPEGGELLISTSQDNQYVKIEIVDTGVGITTENLAKLFTPFFSTKSNGSGLGLTISHQIIQKHQGIIDVKSQPGKGTTFVVKLPITQQTAMNS